MLLCVSLVVRQSHDFAITPAALYHGGHPESGGRHAGTLAHPRLVGDVHAAAQAQIYPSKPVHIVLRYAAGGITDVIARARPAAVGSQETAGAEASRARASGRWVKP
jgi:hypothetical protein